MNPPSRLLIPSHDGARTFTLGSAIYRLRANQRHPSRRYRKGHLVRLIAGAFNCTKPGDHNDPNWRVVCRVRAKTAEFVGVPRRALRLVKR